MIDPRIIHVVDVFGTTERHLRAQATWEPLYKAGVIPVHYASEFDGENARRRLGDSRSLPLFNKVLFTAMMQANEEDVILWTNDDIGLDAEIVPFLKSHAMRRGAVSFRRPWEGNGPHIGRDAFAFTKNFLRMVYPKIPAFYCGAPAFDLVMAALIRKEHRITLTTLENLHQDFAPSDVTAHISHEAHESSWAGANEGTFLANIWNRALASEWCREHMPSLMI